MSKIDLHIDSAAQEWLDSHPGPWSLVQSAELAELRAQVEALREELKTVTMQRDMEADEVTELSTKVVPALKSERDEARKELAEARARVEQLEAWKAACTIDFGTLRAELASARAQLELADEMAKSMVFGEPMPGTKGVAEAFVSVDKIAAYRAARTPVCGPGEGNAT